MRAHNIAASAGSIPDVPHRSVCGALLAAPMACGTRAVRVPRLAAVLGDRSVALVDQVAVLRVQAVALLQRSK